MNAVYHLRPDGQMEIVVEVAGGKPVAALAHRGNALLEVDASGMTLELQPATAAGRSALLGGTLVVDKKSIKDAGGIRNWATKEAFKAADDLKSGRVKLH
jgi:hypothetical protein